MIHIFTLMTSLYNKFFTEQLETVGNLFPGHDKTFNLISDVKPEGYDNISMDGFKEFNFLKIVDFPYPLVTLCKTIYMVEALPDSANDDDIFIYIDSDTIFLDKGKEFYDKILDEIKSHDLMFSHSPWSYHWNKLYPGVSGFWTVSNYNNYIEFMNDNEPEYSSHFICDDKSVYVQTSFFAGKVCKLKKLNKDVRELMTSDLNHRPDFLHPNQPQELIRHIPLASEENYCNKVINDNIHSDSPKYDILVDVYHYNHYYPFTERIDDIKNLFPKIFLKQKYDLGRKEGKRNGN